MGRKSIVFALVMAGVFLCWGLTHAQDWKPTKPLRIIVPWGAGGSTDQAVRSIVGDLEEALGQKVVVVNQPGGGGAIGTQSVMDAPCDGYTWASGAVKDLGTYIITGTLNTKVQDWHVYLKKGPGGEEAVVWYKCPDCYRKDPVFRRKCEVFSRVTGYLRPVSQWNKGKKAEFQQRKTYRM